MTNITIIERPFLPEDFNFTDGHAYRPWFDFENDVVSNATRYFQTSNRQSIYEIEREYVKAFFKINRQLFFDQEFHYLQLHSASQGMEIIANYLRIKGKSISLIEPCFDNLADILRRHTIQLFPFSEELMNCEEQLFLETLETINSDSLCLVLPNNPTGANLTKEKFRLLTSWARNNKKLLILDFCFRGYIPNDENFDHYQILLEADCTFIAIEDTGKTWSLAELKTPFMTVSRDIYKVLYDIWTDMILHVSPVVLAMMTDILKNAGQDGLNQIQCLVKSNHDKILNAIVNTKIQSVGKSNMPVAWLSYSSNTPNELHSKLKSHEVHTLSGELFFWHTQQRLNYLRIALNRDPITFNKAMDKIAAVFNPPA